MTRKKKDAVLNEEEKTSDKEGLEKIINETFSVQDPHIQSIHEYLISRASDGSLEKQQSKGNITKMALDLLQKLKRGNKDAHS